MSLTKEQEGACHDLVSHVAGTGDWGKFGVCRSAHAKLVRACADQHLKTPLHGAALHAWLHEARPYVHHVVMHGDPETKEKREKVVQNAIAFIKKGQESGGRLTKAQRAHVKKRVHAYMQHREAARITRHPIRYRHDPNFMYATVIQERPLFGWPSEYKRYHVNPTVHHGHAGHAVGGALGALASALGGPSTAPPPAAPVAPASGAPTLTPGPSPGSLSGLLTPGAAAGPLAPAPPAGSMPPPPPREPARGKKAPVRGPGSYGAFMPPPMPSNELKTYPSLILRDSVGGTGGKKIAPILPFTTMATGSAAALEAMDYDTANREYKETTFNIGGGAPDNPLVAFEPPPNVVRKRARRAKY